MMKFFLQTTLFVALGFFSFQAPTVFAQEGLGSTQTPVADIAIDEENKVIDVSIEGSEAGTLVEFFLESNSTGELIKFADAPWSPSYLSINVNYLTFTYPFAYDNNNEAQKAIVIKTQNSAGVSSEVLQRFLFENELELTSLLVDFPGWEIAEFKAINENGINGYYPDLKSNGQLSRAESEDLFLILKNIDNDTRIVLAEYSGSGANSFSITWPFPCTNLNPPNCGMPNEAQLTVGEIYEVYLSDSADGLLAVNVGDSESTLVNLGLVPPPQDLVEISSIQKVNNSYFTITGTLNSPGPEELVFRALGPTTEVGDEIFLGNAIIQPGVFTFPQGTPTENQLENVPYTIQAWYNGVVVAQADLAADGTTTPVTINPGTTNPGSNPGPTGPDSANDIMSNGIVTDCGYNIGPGEGGRMCGFADAIRLIRRIIEYIFILVIPIAAIVFAYAGFIYLTSGGSPEKRKVAKRAMTNVLIGIIVVMAAYLIVHTIVTSLGVDDSSANPFFYL